MGAKITLSELSRLLATQTGYASRDTEAFLKELFFEIGSSLEKDDTVKLKGIGTFKTNRSGARKSVDVSTGEEIEIPSHIRVVFTPDKDIAAAINAPFSMFESVEIADGVTDEMLSATEQIESEEIESEEIGLPHTEPEETGLTEEPEIEETVPEPQEEQSEEKDDESPVFEERIEEPEPEPTPEIQEEFTEPEAVMKPVRHGLPSWVWFMFGFASACVLFVCFVIAYRFIEHNQVKDNVQAVEETVVISEYETDPVSDTIPEPGMEEVPETAAESYPDTQPSDKVIYDTVTKTRYLTTMSREYYGSYYFWPYIYEENEKILGHPDRIRPGTKVVIPSLEKYGVDPKNSADVRAAKKKGVAIYARYK